MCQPSIKTWIKKQAGYKDCLPEFFYQCPWTEKRWIFWIIKLVFISYWTATFVVGLQQAQPLSRWWIFLTNWGVIANLLYFYSSYSSATYGMGNKESHHRDIAVSTISDIDDVESPSEEKDLQWLHYVVWILHTVAFNGSLLVTIVYWSALFSGGTISFGNANSHAVNLGIMVLDLFLNRIPVRAMHFYHLSLYGLVYTIFSLILHGTGYESKIYSLLNWADAPGSAAGLCLGLIFIASPIGHAILFALGCLRDYIAGKVNPDLNNRNDLRSTNVTTGAANPAFLQ